MTHYSSYVAYTASNVSSKVPKKAGVYKISRKNPNKASKVIPIYIGQSNDLRRRLTDHLSENEPNGSLKEKVSAEPLWISWAEISRIGDRTTEETDRVEHFHPECNHTNG